MKRIVVRVDARRELADARDYYDQNRPGYGPRFVGAIEDAFATLAEYPLAGMDIPELGVRRLSLTDWPYALVYFVSGDAVVIVALAHHRRQALYWRTRLR